MKPEEAQELQDHIDVFHNLMIDILRRRALFREFEKNLVGKDSKDFIYKNGFVSFYIMDYSRAQLIDLRKFFETDSFSYKISLIIKWVNDPSIKKEHKQLFEEWKNKFQNKVNKNIAHLEKNSGNIAKQIAKKDVDNFINQVNVFLDNIVVQLRKKGTLIINDTFRDLNGDFLNKDQEKEFQEYLKWSSSL